MTSKITYRKAEGSHSPKTLNRRSVVMPLLGCERFKMPLERLVLLHPQARGASGTEDFGFLRQGRMGGSKGLCE